MKEIRVNQSIADRAAAQTEVLDRSLIAADFATVRRLTCADFTIIHPLGQQSGKESWLTWIAANVKYHRIERRGMKIRVHADVALVVSSARSTMSVQGYLNGKPSVHRTVRTEVWISGPDALHLQHVHLTHEPEG